MVCAGLSHGRCGLGPNTIFAYALEEPRLVTTTTTLWRPTGEAELELVRQSGWRRWPPRLPEQPIFYPVLNEEYATQIASRWNTQNGGTGYVLRFRVESGFLQRYEPHVVGGSEHAELWVPAGDLEEFNDHIVGDIELVSAYRGDPPMRLTTTEIAEVVPAPPGSAHSYGSRDVQPSYESSLPPPEPWGKDPWGDSE